MAEPDNEARDGAVTVHLLVAIGDDATLEQRYQPVAEHLGVHAEVELVLEEGEHRVENGADAHLQRGAVVHQGRDDVPDARRHVGLHGWRALDERTIREAERVYARERHHGVSMRARHAVVDLGQHERGVVGGGHRGIQARAERAVAVRAS